MWDKIADLVVVKIWKSIGWKKMRAILVSFDTHGFNNWSPENSIYFRFTYAFARDQNSKKEIVWTDKILI